jgi:predicted transcriptional regulator
MKAIKIARIPPPIIPVTATVKESVSALGSDQGCAAAVMDGQRLVGTLSKDDILVRVVAAGRNPETTLVADIMTQPFPTVAVEAKAEEIGRAHV